MLYHVKSLYMIELTKYAVCKITLHDGTN